MSVVMAAGNVEVVESTAENAFPVARRRLVGLATPQASLSQHVLRVEFRSPGGRRWHAIGGGASVAEAIVFARESCPDDASWDLVGWSDLYGE